MLVSFKMNTTVILLQMLWTVVFMQTAAGTQYTNEKFLPPDFGRDLYIRLLNPETNIPDAQLQTAGRNTHSKNER